MEVADEWEARRLLFSRLRSALRRSLSLREVEEEEEEAALRGGGSFTRLSTRREGPEGDSVRGEEVDIGGGAE